MLAVLAISQPAACCWLWWLSRRWAPTRSRPETWRSPSSAGAASLGGLGAFYAAMAMGTISVVAPIAALGVVIPVAVGLARGGAHRDPDGRSGGRDRRGGGAQPRGGTGASAGARRSILLAIGAAIGFGLFFTGLDVASTDGPAGRSSPTARRHRGDGCSGGRGRPSFAGVGAALPALLAIGSFDMLANTLFARRLHQGPAAGGRGRRLDVPGLHHRPRPLRAGRTPDPPSAPRPLVAALAGVARSRAGPVAAPD